MKNTRINDLLEKRGRKINPDMCVYHDTSAFMDIESGDTALQVLRKKTIHVLVVKGTDQHYVYI